MLGLRNITVYCFMGDFGCGSGGWTLVMKTDGAKVKEGNLLIHFYSLFREWFILLFLLISLLCYSCAIDWNKKKYILICFITVFSNQLHRQFRRTNYKNRQSMTVCSLLRPFLLRITFLATRRWITDEAPKQINGKEEVMDTLLTKWKFFYEYLLYTLYYMNGFWNIYIPS